jgi:hypothetical protein
MLAPFSFPIVIMICFSFSISSFLIVFSSWRIFPPRVLELNDFDPEIFRLWAWQTQGLLPLRPANGWLPSSTAYRNALATGELLPTGMDPSIHSDVFARYERGVLEIEHRVDDVRNFTHPSEGMKLRQRRMTRR